MKKLLLLFVVFLLAGCGTAPQSHTEYTDLAPLNNGWSRIYVNTGRYYPNSDTNSSISNKLWRVEEVGTVFVDGKRIGDLAKDESIVVDLLPGTYEFHWIPGGQPYKFCSVKAAVVVGAGETKYFTSDLVNNVSMAWGLAGAAGGLIGSAASDCNLNGMIDERPSLDPESKLVSYVKFSGKPIGAIADSSKAPSNDQPSSVVQKLRELDGLKKDGVITESEYQQKKKELLEKF